MHEMQSMISAEAFSSIAFCYRKSIKSSNHTVSTPQQHLTSCFVCNLNVISSTNIDEVPELTDFKSFNIQKNTLIFWPLLCHKLPESTPFLIQCIHYLLDTEKCKVGETVLGPPGEQKATLP